MRVGHQAHETDRQFANAIYFEPMRKQVEAWQRSELTDVAAKVVIYEAFIEGKLEAPKHLARSVHDLYFEPKYEEFRPRTIWRFPMRLLRHSRS